MQATLEADAFLFFGAGGHASVILEALLAHDATLIERCLVDASSFSTPTTTGRTHLAGHSLRVWKGGAAGFKQAFPNGYAVMAVTTRLAQQKILFECTSASLPMATVIHPTAWVSPSATLGVGVQVLPYGVVHTQATLGDMVIVNTHAVVEHQARVGDFTAIAPGAKLLGEVVVGSRCMIGSNAVIRQTLTVGDGVTVGAGAVVVKSVPDYTLVKGVPAR
jgi:sugar O-acyltransferase (sialic acid O-acetyltransferase NeuD family)